MYLGSFTNPAINFCLEVYLQMKTEETKLLSLKKKRVGISNDFLKAFEKLRDKKLSSKGRCRSIDTALHDVNVWILICPYLSFRKYFIFLSKLQEMG